MKTNWKRMEGAPEAASALAWRLRLEQDFQPVATLALRRTEREVRWVPCPDGCCGGHRVVPVRQGGGGFLGVCDDDEPMCEDLNLTDELVRVWEMDFARLGRAVARVLECAARDDEMGPSRTWQIGAFGAAGMPVVLTMPREAAEFRQAVAEVTLRLREHFILLAPTSRFMDATCHGILKTAKAGFLDLGSLLTLEADGSLRALRPAAELFTPYLPATAGAGMVAPVGPAYLLRKELGLWRLVFDRKEGVIEDGRGMQLAAYLLKHPPAEPLHAVALEAKIAGHDAQGVAAVLVESTTGGTDATVERDSVMQERTQWNEGGDVLLKRKLMELRETMEDATLPESEQEAARDEFYSLVRASDRGRLLGDGATRAADRVGKALKRLHRELSGAELKPGVPNTVLRAFGEHLRLYILVPSMRYAGPKARFTTVRAAGCFTYERPSGVNWAE